MKYSVFEFSLINSVAVFSGAVVRGAAHMPLIYRIAPNFQGAQFSRIGVFKHFVETIFADHGFRYSMNMVF